MALYRQQAEQLRDVLFTALNVTHHRGGNADFAPIPWMLNAARRHGGSAGLALNRQFNDRSRFQVVVDIVGHLPLNRKMALKGITSERLGRKTTHHDLKITHNHKPPRLF